MALQRLIRHPVLLRHRPDRRHGGPDTMVNTEPGEFGPNTAQVERFLALLERLDDGDWAKVEAAGVAAPAAELPAEVLLTFAEGFAKRAGDVAYDRAPPPGNVDLLAQRAAQ